MKKNKHNCNFSSQTFFSDFYISQFSCFCFHHKGNFTSQFGLFLELWHYFSQFWVFTCSRTVRNVWIVRKGGLSKWLKTNLNFVLKYYQYSNYILNLKGIISVRGEKAVGFSPEAQRGASSKILLMHIYNSNKITWLSLKKVHNV